VNLVKQLCICSALILMNFSLWANEKANKEDAEYLEVERVKEKYWAQGDESQLGVVQNRLYSKQHKYQIGLLAGKAMNDPFLSVNKYGLNVSYNFTEFWGLSVLGWQYIVSSSNALKTLRNGGKQANTIEPQSFIGSEVSGSFLYGKLSLLGQSIIYYDMHFTAGLGLTKTENDRAAFSSSVGIGQRFYINQHLSLRMDYRLQTYTATETEKEITARLGEVNGRLRHFNHVLTGELNFMFGGNK
jgi:outer membrane beta-barrel protein